VIASVACCLMTTGCAKIETNDVTTDRLSFISDVQFDAGVSAVVTRISGGVDGSGLNSIALNIPVSSDELLQGRLGTQTKRFVARPLYMDDPNNQNPPPPNDVVETAERSVEHYVSFPGNPNTQLQLTFTRANGTVFTRNLDLPPPITLVSPTPSQVLSIEQDITVTWDASGYTRNEGMIVLIEGGDESQNNGADLCLRYLETFATQNTGVLTIPAGSIGFSEDFTGNQCQVSVRLQTAGSVGLYPAVNDGLAWEINILNRHSNVHPVTLTR
jgi:hypothetical protein